MFFTFHLKC